MPRGDPAKGLILRTTCTLVADEVRIGTAEPRRTDGLVGIDHNLVVCSALDGMLVMIDSDLAVVVLTTRDEVADIAALHRIIAIVLHQLIGLVHVLLVVHDRRGGLVVHDELHTLRVGILIERLDIEVGVRRLEVEDIFLRVAEPVFPTDIPALDEDTTKAMLSGEVDVAADVLIICRVTARGLSLRVVGEAELDGGELRGIGPVALTRDHLPPYADVLRGVDPRGILDLTGLVEIEDEVRGEDLACVIGDHDRTPRALAGRLKVAPDALCIGSQPRAEDHVLIIKVEVHRRVVHQRSLVEVDIEAIVRLELQRGLYPRLGEGGLRSIVRHLLLEERADLTKA